MKKKNNIITDNNLKFSLEWVHAFETSLISAQYWKTPFICPSFVSGSFNWPKDSDDLPWTSLYGGRFKLRLYLYAYYLG